MAAYHYVQRTETRYFEGFGWLPIAVQVVFFISIPDINNDAGVSYRVAAKDEKWDNVLNAVPSQVVDLETKSPTVYGDLQNGSLYELAERFQFSSAHLTDQQRNAELTVREGEAEAEILGQKQLDWKYWGRSDLP